MLHIIYQQKTDGAGSPVYDALAGFIMVTGRVKNGWQLPNKRLAIEELADEQKAVYLSLAESLTSKGENWVARSVSVGEVSNDESNVVALELVIYAVQDGTGATRTFTSRENEELRVVDEEVINLYNELHA